MNALRLVLAGALVVGLVGLARADDKDDKVKSKLVGTWEVEKGDARTVPVGAKFQFTKDGKVVVTFKRDEEERKIEGTYKVDGTTLKVTTKRNDKERTQELKISSVDDKKLVIESAKGESVTLKRVAKGKKKE